MDISLFKQFFQHSLSQLISWGRKFKYELDNKVSFIPKMTQTLHNDPWPYTLTLPLCWHWPWGISRCAAADSGWWRPVRPGPGRGWSGSASLWTRHTPSVPGHSPYTRKTTDRDVLTEKTETYTLYSILHKTLHFWQTMISWKYSLQKVVYSHVDNAMFFKMQPYIIQTWKLSVEAAIFERMKFRGLGNKMIS